MSNYFNNEKNIDNKNKMEPEKNTDKFNNSPLTNIDIETLLNNELLFHENEVPFEDFNELNEFKRLLDGPDVQTKKVFKEKCLNFFSQGRKHIYFSKKKSDTVFYDVFITPDHIDYNGPKDMKIHYVFSNGMLLINGKEQDPALTFVFYELMAHVFKDISEES